jgi:hypothetical protein
MKRIALILAITVLLSGCRNPFEATDISMEKAWALDKSESNALECSKSGEHSFIDGFEHIVFDCQFNQPANNVELVEIFDGKFDKSSFRYGRTVIDGQFFEVKDYVVETQNYIEENPALSGYGQICLTHECSKDDKFAAGYKFKSVFSEPGSASSKKLKLQYALWDVKKRIWLGTSKLFSLRIPADPELVAYEAGKLEIEKENQAAADLDFANEQLVKKSYDEGRAFILDSSADFLLTMPGLINSFGVKGNPIKGKMLLFCSSLYSETLLARGHLSSSKSLARKNWNKGCFDAAMKITLSDLNMGNN